MPNASMTANGMILLVVLLSNNYEVQHHDFQLKCKMEEFYLSAWQLTSSGFVSDW
jgi:ABC-type long-subunit fatty acid transport system fused permease/ATPase subunit